MKEVKKGTNKMGIKAKLKAFFYGMVTHEMVRQALKTKLYHDQLFMLTTLGDMFGIPILPPYYSLELLPYAMPNIAIWKKRIFRERDFTD
ncbi:MAG: hypothetical protein ACFFCD_14805 [Promethearchaeota archaeon]